MEHWASFSMSLLEAKVCPTVDVIHYIYNNTTEDSPPRMLFVDLCISMRLVYENDMPLQMVVDVANRLHSIVRIDSWTKVLESGMSGNRYKSVK